MSNHVAKTAVPRSRFTHDLSDYFHRQSFDKLVLLTGLFVWLWILYAIQEGLVNAQQGLLMVVLVLGAGWLLFSLYSQRYRAAVYTFITSQFLLIALMLYFTGNIQVGYLFLFAIISAGALVGPLGAYAIAAAAIVTETLLAMNGYLVDVPFGLMVQQLLAAYVAHQAQQGLHFAVASAEISAEAARRHAEEARLHRGELQKAQKSLHLANYQLQRANAELFSAREVAEAAMRFKSDFAAQSSHEFRTSLNLILGFSETIAFSQHTYGAKLPPAYLRDITEIHRNSRHLLTLIDDILDLSRLEAGRMGLHREPVDINNIVTETAEILRPMVERKGIDLRVELTPGLPYLWLDRVRIRQVLSNLLSNAARVTAQGAITLRTESREGEVVVAVADTGPGIEEEDLQAIFTEFFQADRVEGQSGRVGLGLAVSKQIILLHGGRIWAASEIGQGSTFYFGFTLESDTVSPLIRGKPLLPFRPPLPSIVVIGGEDAEEVRFLRRHLDEEFTLVAAATWEDAPRMVQQSNARAVIANVLPDEATALEKKFSVPLISCPVPGPTQIARALGINDFVQKPVVSATLQATLRRLPSPLKSLLLVDDEPAAVRLIERIIHSSDPGIKTARAYSGQDAWARLQAQRPDAVVLDLSMANGDGIWLIARLRQHEALAHLPVIAVSGRAVEDLWQTRKIGIAGGEGFSATEVLGYLRAVLKALPPAGVEPHTTLQPALEMRPV